MLIMFSLFGGRKGDSDPLQRVGVASSSCYTLAKGNIWHAGGDPLSAHGTGELQGTFWSMRGSHGNVGDSEGTLHLFAEV